MTTTVVSYAKPATFVKMQNINVNKEKWTFSMDVYVAPTREMLTVDAEHHDPSVGHQHVTGTVTSDLWRWLHKVSDVNVKVVAQNEQGFEWMKTGERLTQFQRHLQRAGFGSLIHSADMLKEMIYICDNKSTDVTECPFRLTMLGDKNILTHVASPSKLRFEEVDINTGEVKVEYRYKTEVVNGRTVRMKLKPDQYCRLIVKQTTEREIYEEASVTVS